MTAKLTRTVVAKGAFFAAGTLREGEAAKLVPDGPWWSGPAAAEVTPEGVVVASEAVVDEQGPAEPPRAGEGSGTERWREYATALGIKLADDASRADIIAAVDAR